MKKITRMTINVEWIKSRQWGFNPHLAALIILADGTAFRTKVYKCSGCGYDKESTVISMLFNEHLRDRLKHRRKITAPYGVYLPSNDSAGYYGDGIGIDCYYRIVAWLGGKMTHAAAGKYFDVYEIKFKS